MTTRRRLLVLFGSSSLVLGTALCVYRTSGWAQHDGSFSAVAVDLTRPDALVRTQSLSQLPRDLLEVPAARDLLTEDLVFYYEDHPDRLGLKGTLRRLAYEHELTWNDDLIAWALDRPADVALWRGGDGRLRHWVMALSRPELARVVQEAATIAMKDRELTRVGAITVDGDDVEVFALEYAPARRLLLASHGDRVVLLSHPGLLLDPDGVALAGSAGVVARLLSSDASRQAVFREAFRLEGAAPKHSVVVAAHTLSFGYQRFFPGLAALRFDFGASRWSTHVLFEGARLPRAALLDRELWSGVPAGAAACALAPVQWQEGRSVLESASVATGRPLASLSQELEGPAAVCWYPGSRLHAPLVAATLKAPRPELEPLLAALFDWAVARRAEGRGPLQKRRAAPSGVVMQRAVQVPYAAVGDGGELEPALLQITFAWAGRHVFFSPDPARVEQALAVAARRYPSVADALAPATAPSAAAGARGPMDGVTLGLLSPAALAALGRREALAMLPRGSEPIFRGAAERLLLPRLEALARHPAYRLVLADTTPPREGQHDAAAPDGWQPVEWQELRR